MQKHKENSLVSVIIPSYNSEKFIKRAVSSVLNQTYQNIEVIIVQNGGNPLPEMKQDPRLRVVSLKKNKGVSNARNIGIREAKGDYIALLDADDYWEPDKLMLQIKLINNYDDSDKPVICFTGRRLFYEKNNKIKKGGYVGCDNHVTYKRLLRSNQINCSSVVMSRETALKNPFPDGKKMHEDYAVWLRILKNGGYAAGINRPLINYRVAHDSKSGNKLRSAVMTFKVYRFIGLGFLESIMHMVTYTFFGIKKYI